MEVGLRAGGSAGRRCGRRRHLGRGALRRKLTQSAPLPGRANRVQSGMMIELMQVANSLGAARPIVLGAGWTGGRARRLPSSPGDARRGAALRAPVGDGPEHQGNDDRPDEGQRPRRAAAAAAAALLSRAAGLGRRARRRSARSRRRSSSTRATTPGRSPAPRRRRARRPRSVEAHHNRAIALMQLDRLDEARDALELALALAPDDPETLEAAADLQINQLPPSGDRSALGLEYARRGSRHVPRARRRARSRGWRCSRGRR